MRKKLLWGGALAVTLLALAGILAVAIFGMYGPGFSADQFLYMDF